MDGADDLPTPAAVILDLDGTLVDTVQTRIAAWMHTFAEVGLVTDEARVAALIGSDGRWLTEQVARAAGRTLQPGEAEVIDRRAGERYAALNRDPRPLPGAGALLDALEARRIPWAIATSSRRAQVGVSIAALGRRPRPLVVDGTSVRHAKPAPDLILRAASRLGAKPSVTWCIGDARWDMLAAGAAGAVAVGVATGAASEEELRTAGARLTVPSLAALLAHLPG